jgi:hypothetical protein
MLRLLEGVLPEYLRVIGWNHRLLDHWLWLRKVVLELLLLGMVVQRLLQGTLIPVELGVVCGRRKQRLGLLEIIVTTWQRLLINWCTSSVLESALWRGNTLRFLVEV